MGCETVRDEWIARADLVSECGEKWVLDYYLQHFDGEGDEKFFGLRIDKNSPTGELIEREETFAITESRDDAIIMINAFAKGSVPPVTLLEMADEWYSEYSEARLLPI
ncbi:MAG: DUF6514 family protein [Defluviitaleaceae bacterium]|nr:DUF6514 family protein [Defluviitaleaceae bacterium]